MICGIGFATLSSLNHVFLGAESQFLMAQSITIPILLAKVLVLAPQIPVSDDELTYFGWLKVRIFAWFLTI